MTEDQAKFLKHGRTVCGKQFSPGEDVYVEKFMRLNLPAVRVRVSIYYISYSRTFLSILNAICPVHRLSTIFRTLFLSILNAIALCPDTVLFYSGLLSIPMLSALNALVQYYISYSRMFLSRYLQRCLPCAQIKYYDFVLKVLCYFTLYMYGDNDTSTQTSLIFFN